MSTDGSMNRSEFLGDHHPPINEGRSIQGGNVAGVRFPRLAVAIVVGLLVSVQSVLAQTVPDFEDVPEGHVAEFAIVWAGEKGITVGVGNNRFGVGQTLTRYEMVTFLCRAFDPDNCTSGTRGSDRFVDVPVDHWANYSVGWAVSRDITSGVSATEFGGMLTLTREQMITLLYRAEGSPSGGSRGSDVYGDVPDDRSQWANLPIGWAFDQGVTGGIAEGTFGFGTNLSREEMVLFLCRALASDICSASQEPLASSVVPTTPTTDVPRTGETYRIGYVRDSVVDMREGGRIHDEYYSLLGTPDLFLVNLGDLESRQITEGGGYPVWSPDGTKIAYVETDRSTGSQIFVMDADGGNRKSIAVGTDPAWSPDGTKIAFEGAFGLFTVGIDGSNLQRLVHGLYPAWSPDGTKIAYLDFLPSEQGHTHNIFVMDADGSNPQQLAQADGETPYIRLGPVWSPVGANIAYVETDISGNSRIVVMDADGGNRKSIGEGDDPAWSPDGTKIAYTKSSGTFVVNADGTNPVQLSRGTDPAWSPDGARISFVDRGVRRLADPSQLDGDLGPGDFEFTERIVVVGVNTGTRQVIAEEIIPPRSGHVFTLVFTHDSAPMWSPSGDHIAYSHADGGIYLADTGGLIQLTQYWTDFDATWSPSDAQVVFTSDRDGDAEIFVMNADGTNPVQLTQNLGHDGDPAWSPDGTHIAYTGTDVYGDPNEIAVVASNGENRQVLARGTSPIWSPDGAHIAFTSWGADGNELIVMEAAGEEPHRIFQSRSSIEGLVWSLNSQRIAFASNGLHVIDIDGENLQQLTTDHAADPSWSPDGTKIAYTTFRRIFVVNVDDGSSSQLGRSVGAGPTWSPDGTRIAFTSGGSGYLTRVSVVDADGTNPLVLTPAGGRDPVWSSDSKRILYTYGGGINVVDADGSSIRQLTTHVYWDEVPVLSPDGTKTVNVRLGVGLFVMDSDGTNVQQITESMRDRHPVWSSDGTRIAYSSAEGISVVDADGSNLRQITEYIAERPVWSPDDKRIVYRARVRVGNTAKSQTELVNVESGNPVKLSQDWALGTLWSPDGTSIAYSISGRTGREIIVVNTDTGERQSLTEGWGPAWSPDGTKIAYTSQANTIVKIMDADGTNQQSLVMGWAPVWSPDGNSIAYIGRGESGATDIFVINTDGTNPRQITHGGGRNPVWLPSDQ